MNQKITTIARVLMSVLILFILSHQAGHAQEGQFRKFLNQGSFSGVSNERYVPPVTNPLFNETPFITTEIKPIYIYNDISNDFITDGGSINVIAAQLRLALTDRLGLIATKDGYVDANFDSVLPDETGFANLSIGLKYALFHNKETQSIFTIGVEYEIPIQDIDPAGIELQGAGDGFIDVFAAGATTIGKIGLEANAGVNFALDNDADTSIFHLSGHANYQLTKNFFPLVELNVFTPIDDGERLVGPLAELDGVDLVNFGSSSRDTTVTGAAGFRYRFNENLIFGIGGETALTSNDDSILGWRMTTDIVWHF